MIYQLYKLCGLNDADKICACCLLLNFEMNGYIFQSKDNFFCFISRLFVFGRLIYHALFESLFLHLI